MSGKIYLVGSGPGDVGMLTLRGYEVLRRADVVIYDHLVGEGIIAMIPENAQRIDAGKVAGKHNMTQREIESLMIDLALTGKNVVRLKGGDPYIFGRGGEEAEAIMRSGISFEVVPGVTSAISVPSYAGIPITHREYSSCARIMTGHDKNNLIPDDSDSTTIILMGVSNSELLQTRLLQTNSPETPCAIIANGTTSFQRTIRTKLSTLHSSIQSNGITPPAIIVVGVVAELNLDWRKSLPLSGKRIIITRPEGRAEKLSLMLRDLGAEVIMLPTIRTRIIPGSLDGVKLDGYEWAGFTSVTGVEALFVLLREAGRDIRELGSAKIAAIGTATKEALNAHGLRVDYVPEVYDGHHMAEGLCELGGNILMFRAENGTPEINSVFMKYGKAVKEVCIYGIDYVELCHVPDKADIIVFTSSSTVKGFCANTDKLRDTLAVCIGIQTAEEAVKSGFERVRIAERAELEAIVDACTREYTAGGMCNA